jgi:lambda repressor-like predicted transcriptional regulator
LIATYNATVVTYLQNQGGTHSFSLYLLCREIMLLCDSLQTVLTMRHIPGNQNLIADALSRFRVPMCGVKIFLTFTSPNMVLLWQLFYLFCSCVWILL